MFDRVLIANRGEIAVRIQRTLRALGIQSVVVYHALERESAAVGQADLAIEIGGATPVAAYLDVEQIIDACRESGSQAVHPGFGFLAENASFARRLGEAGIRFIGPRPEVLELMGNKIGARQFCLDHDFPIVASITETEDPERFTERMRELGLPILIKSAAGGGGKGMHIVTEPDQLDAVCERARGEASRSFGDPTLLAERYVDCARHIEVQILADEHGKVLHLGERECSVQRRFQKIVEEAPAPNLDTALRERIHDTAVRIASAAGYSNAGTVEFLLAPDGAFYFLEMNTRIQVEHPVTEAITGVDLVAKQLEIAASGSLDLHQREIRFHGHALEVRLYAEDPDNDFTPSIGRLLRYRLSPTVRVDDGYHEGQEVTPAFDPMLAKLIAHAETREAAIDALHAALCASTVFGVTTNLDLLGRILRHASFRSGETHTGFLAEHAASLGPPPLSDRQRAVLLSAAALASRDFVNAQFEPQPLHAALGAWRN